MIKYEVWDMSTFNCVGMTDTREEAEALILKEDDVIIEVLLEEEQFANPENPYPPEALGDNPREEDLGGQGTVQG